MIFLLRLHMQIFLQCSFRLSEKKLEVTFLLSYFCMTKRRVKGGKATSERRRRDGASWVEFVRKQDKEISIIDTSSVSLRLPPSPTGEGWQKTNFFKVKRYTRKKIIAFKMAQRKMA